tara:strand:+ start:71 stop:349 length:279 start_codon:yes stop_codon:yes gene_type:complete
MERTLTLYFKYKDLSGKVGEYEVFATAVVNATDNDEVKKTNDWFTRIMELKIKSDPEVAGVYISDEVKQLTKEDLKTVTASNVVMLNKESEE